MMSDDTRRMVEAANELAGALTPGDLDHTLGQITATAVRVLPHVDYASITINHSGGKLETKAPTDDVLCELDAAQYELQEGPCYYAATEKAHIISANLAADERFPKYGPKALAAGVRSQAGLRLFTGRQAQGALNLYSRSVGAFEDMESLGGLFSSQSGMVIAYAMEVENLKEALQTRTMIGQAVGIIMERYALTDDRAFAFLTRLSQNRNVKLRMLAQEIIAASEDRGEDGEPPALGDPRT
jgi:hypothetical protein